MAEKAHEIDEKRSAELKGDVFLADERHQSFTTAQVQLLQAIDDSGSISKAAKQLGISYKTAWERVDALNNLAEQPVVIRATGGAKGGGTQVTDYGRALIAGFTAIIAEHQAFLQRLGSKLHSLGDISRFLRGPMINSSARNQFSGLVQHVTHGEVSAEVVLQISERQTIVATVTEDSIGRLQLLPGAKVIALIKASQVILSTDTHIASSARNKLSGTISRVTKGTVNSDVTIDLGGGKTLSATVTNAVAETMKLEPEQQACGIFKASSVILIAE